MDFTEFLKVWIGPILTLLALLPTLIFVNANRRKILQDIKSARAKQLSDDADASEKYRAALAATVEESLGKSQTLKSLRDMIEARDQNIDELNTELTSEKSARKAQDAKILEQDQRIERLTNELAEERAQRLTALVELSNLKASSGSLIAKLTSRVKTLEDTLVEHKIPVPKG